MRQLHEKVNIVPIIAKADMLTPDECVRFKRKVGRERVCGEGGTVMVNMSPPQVMEDMVANNIKIYQFPDPKLDDDDDAANSKLRVGSITFPSSSSSSNISTPHACCRKPFHLQWLVAQQCWRSITRRSEVANTRGVWLKVSGRGLSTPTTDYLFLQWIMWSTVTSLCCETC